MQRLRYVLTGIIAIAIIALLPSVWSSLTSSAPAAPSGSAGSGRTSASTSSIVPTIQITAAPPPPTPPQAEAQSLPIANSGPNPIYNPSFEIKAPSGQPDGWTTGHYGANNASFTYPVPGYDDAAAAKVSISQYANGAAEWHFKNIPAGAGQAYAFSDYYIASTSTYVTVQFTSASGAQSYIDIADPAPANDWTRSVGAFYVPQGTVSLTVLHVLKSAGTLVTDDYSLSPVRASFPQGTVSINFDDGRESGYATAFPILQAAQVHATFYIVTHYLGDSAYMTVQQVLALQAAGEEIGAHTRDHPHLPALTPVQMEDEIAGSLADLKAIGVNSVTTFAYPYGEYNAQADAIVRQAGFAAARTTESSLDFPESDPFLLHARTVTSNTTVAQVEGWINEAVADKQWLILVFHELNTQFLASDPYSWSSADFQQVVNYLKANNVPVMTNAAAVKTYFGK